MYNHGEFSRILYGTLQHTIHVELQNYNVLYLKSDVCDLKNCFSYQKWMSCLYHLHIVHTQIDLSHSIVYICKIVFILSMLTYYNDYKTVRYHVRYGVSISIFIIDKFKQILEKVDVS